MKALTRHLGDPQLREHVAFVYETEEQHRALVAAFVRQGLEGGAKVVYLRHSHPAQEILASLRSAGLQPEPYLASGQLAIVDASEVYLVNGRFDPAAALAGLQQAVARAAQEGYTGLYVTGEMTWALEGRPGSELLAEYERAIDASFPAGACVGMCQYHRHRFDPALLLQVLPAHSTVIFGDQLASDACPAIPAPPNLGLPSVQAARLAGDAPEQARLGPPYAMPAPGTPGGVPRGDGSRGLERAMAHRLAVEEALARVSSLLASGEPADLTGILAILGEAVCASRAYLFHFRDGTLRADNTYEWCAPGVEPQLANLQDVDCAPLTWWVGKLQRNEEIAIPDLDQMPPEAAAERRILEPQGIRALLVVPMFSRGQLAGFLGFDDTWRPRQWPPEDTRLLRTAAETLVAYEERKRAVEALSFLAEASRVLGGSLDFEATLQSVARLCVPTLADWCVVSIAASDGTPRQVAYAHADPTREPLIAALRQRYTPSPDGPHPAYHVERSGEWVIRSQISDEDWARAAPDAGFLSLMRQLEVRSCLVVPLVARGRVIGSISLASSRPHRYAAPDLALAEDLARRAALAIDNARLYREAQQAIRSRDAFLSVAAHELKTPITGLRGFAQLALRRLRREGELPPGQIEHTMEVIDQQTDRLSRLVTRLLDVSRIGAGELHLQRRVTDLAAMVNAAVALARARHKGQQITVRTVPVSAFVDAVRLEQVLDNLLENACKFNRAGEPIEVDLAAGDGTISLAVRDHGAGIAPEERKRIFERYYATEPGHARSGMGLGLYVANHIVALHGGHIEVECPPGGGTRFVVRLPAGFGEGLPGAQEPVCK